MRSCGAAGAARAPAPAAAPRGLVWSDGGLHGFDWFPGLHGFHGLHGFDGFVGDCWEQVCVVAFWLGSWLDPLGSGTEHGGAFSHCLANQKIYRLSI